MKVFNEHCSSSLFNLNLYLLYYVVKDLRVFGTLSVLDESPFEQYNVDIKQGYRITSGKSDTCMN